MKIIIIGAGRVGASLAHHLAAEKNDIILVDTDYEKLSHLQDQLDVQTLCAHGGHPSTLALAGAEDADMLIAVTHSDEINMIACQVAYALFRTPLKIARIRAVEYAQHANLYNNQALPIDVLISPEQILTSTICQLIEHPDALQVLDFAEGDIKLVALKVTASGTLSECALHSFHQHELAKQIHLLTLYRDGGYIAPTAEQIFMPGDILYLLTTAGMVNAAINLWHPTSGSNRNIILAGGGNIGRKCAAQLGAHYNVKLIEKYSARAKRLAETLQNVIVLKGDASDKTLLLEADIDQTDIFCALTQFDEANILSALLAKHTGAKQALALINHPPYVDIMEASVLDHVISPQEATIGSLLTHVRRGDVVKVHSLAHGSAEALEGIVHGTHENAPLVGKRIQDLTLPPGCLLGAIKRKNDIFIQPQPTEVILEGDHVIFFVHDRNVISEVEQLFQVGVTFL